MVDVDEGLDRLYGLPIGEFTAARDRLAVELRDQGDREAAAAVKAARRPTLPAWTVNQLVRSHRDDVEELISIGDELEAAQRAVLSGAAAAGVREASERRRRLIDRLLQGAEELLAEAGHATSRSTLDGVRDTLMAATTDDDAAEAVRAGRLTRELTPPSGFEALAADLPAPAPGARTRDRQAEARAERAVDKARTAAEAADEADREASRLEQEAERARREADRTHREAERARRKADRAAARAEELRREAEEQSKG